MRADSREKVAIRNLNFSGGGGLFLELLVLATAFVDGLISDSKGRGEVSGELGDSGGNAVTFAVRVFCRQDDGSK